MTQELLILSPYDSSHTVARITKQGSFIQVFSEREELSSEILWNIERGIEENWPDCTYVQADDPRLLEALGQSFYKQFLFTYVARYVVDESDYENFPYLNGCWNIVDCNWNTDHLLDKL